MEIDKIFDKANVDGVADNLFSAVRNSVSEIKAMQQRKAAENVQLVIQALKKIESDLQDKFDGVTTVIEKRVSTIKDGRDGINGRDGRDGKDGRPGKDGAPGPRGKDGAPGKDGVDGVDGVSVTDARIDFDGSLIIGLSSGREINVGEVVAPDLAERIKVITNGGGTSQSVLDALASLQSQINALDGFLDYKGTWNASTNTPTLVSSTGTKGDYYVVSVAGSTNLNGETTWGVGDWVVFNNSTWQKVDGGSTGNFTTAAIATSLNLAYGTASTALALDASKNVVSVTNTGTGNNVLATSPVLTTPNLGTPSAVILTNGTGLPISTGVSGLGAGVATFLATPSSANLASAVTNETGTGSLVFSNSPTLVTPALGTPSSATLTNATGLPISTGVSGLGTGVATALAVNTGSTGAFVVNGGALGTPSSGTVTNLTGTASININGTVGATTANSGSFTTLTTSSTVTHNGGTANGVTYLNASKVLTSGSALTFDGTTFGVSSAGIAANLTHASGSVWGVKVIASGSNELQFSGNIAANSGPSIRGVTSGGAAYAPVTVDGSYLASLISGSEQTRLTSTGLKVGTTSDFASAKVVTDGGGIGILNKGLLRSSTDGVLQVSADPNNAYASSQISFDIDGSTVATFNASGNLGLGVTPSAWGANWKALQGGTGSAFANYVGASQAWIFANAYADGASSYRYLNTAAAGAYQLVGNSHAWYTAPSGTAGNAITFTQAMTLDANRNLLLNGTTAGASSVGTLTIFNGTAPTGSVTDGVILFAADVSSSSELRVRDEAGNVTTLSPHNFDLIPEGPSEEMAWAYYSEKNGKKINVDMLKLARMVEKLTGEKLVYEA